jgi:hypothetical protein
VTSVHCGCESVSHSRMGTVGLRAYLHIHAYYMHIYVGLYVLRRRQLSCQAAPWPVKIFSYMLIDEKGRFHCLNEITASHIEVFLTSHRESLYVLLNHL